MYCKIGVLIKVDITKIILNLVKISLKYVFVKFYRKNKVFKQKFISPY